MRPSAQLAGRCSEETSASVAVPFRRAAPFSTTDQRPDANIRQVKSGRGVSTSGRVERKDKSRGVVGSPVETAHVNGNGVGPESLHAGRPVR